MGKTVHVNLGERSYDICIGTGLSIGEVLGNRGFSSALIVSDSNVDPLYGGKCLKQLEKCGMVARRTVVPAGETSKNLNTVRSLYEEALRSSLDRGSVIIALGGGMIGDLAGFVAATFLRGIRFVQVPTSLLAMVDSSVGGKTGVDLPEGKNLVGAFFQPAAVISDLDALKTLPEREYISGLAEVVKYGVIWDERLFGTLEQNVGKIMARDPVLLEEVIARCCEIKAEVVAVDEREGGIRAILNFGHTFGHALEQASEYTGLLHGEAVAVGMAYAGAVSVRERGFAEADYVRMTNLLERFGLPLRPSGGCEWTQLKRAMAADKKTRASTARLVLVERLGSVVYGCQVREEVLENVFSSFCGGSS